MEKPQTAQLVNLSGNKGDPNNPNPTAITKDEESMPSAVRKEANFDMNQEFSLEKLHKQRLSGAKMKQRPKTTIIPGRKDVRRPERIEDMPGNDQFNRAVVNFLFFLVLFMNILINVDHGVMPAGSIVIKDYLGVNNTEYGLLGSVVFMGLTAGSIGATLLY